MPKPLLKLLVAIAKTLIRTKGGRILLAAAVVGVAVYAAARVTVRMPLLVPLVLAAYGMAMTGLAFRRPQPAIVHQAPQPLTAGQTATVTRTVPERPAWDFTEPEPEEI